MASIVQRSMITIVAVLLGGFLFLILCVWMFQERIAFQPEGPPFPDPLDAARVDYSAVDGQKLFAYLVGNPATAKGLVIVFHGNADLAVRSLDWAREIEIRTGLAILLPEYRGYMGIEGRPTYETAGLDATAAYDFAHTVLQVEPGRLAYLGHSLGSAVAAELAVKHPPRSLLLEAPFTSARDMARLIGGRWLTGGLWRLISRFYFDTEQIVASLETPVSVAHGGLDSVVPPEMGDAVFRAARVKGEWLFVPAASHSDLHQVGGKQYWEWATRALRVVGQDR